MLPLMSTGTLSASKNNTATLLLSMTIMHNVEIDVNDNNIDNPYKKVFLNKVGNSIVSNHHQEIV